MEEVGEYFVGLSAAVGVKSRLETVVVGRGCGNIYVMQLIGDYGGCARVNWGICVNSGNVERMEMIFTVGLLG